MIKEGKIITDFKTLAVSKDIFCDGELLYQYVEDNGLHSLYYFEGAPWNLSCQGKLAVSLRDTGDDLVFSARPPKKMNYSYASQLNILLKLLHLDRKLEVGERKEL